MRTEIGNIKQHLLFGEKKRVFVDQKSTYDRDEGNAKEEGHHSANLGHKLE